MNKPVTREQIDKARAEGNRTIITNRFPNRKSRREMSNNIADEKKQSNQYRYSGSNK